MAVRNLQKITELGAECFKKALETIKLCDERALKMACRINEGFSKGEINLMMTLDKIAESRQDAIDFFDTIEMMEKNHLGGYVSDWLYKHGNNVFDTDKKVIKAEVTDGYDMFYVVSWNPNKNEITIQVFDEHVRPKEHVSTHTLDTTKYKPNFYNAPEFIWSRKYEECFQCLDKIVAIKKELSEFFEWLDNLKL